MTHICVGNLTIIGLDNGLSPGRRQTIIRTNAGILLLRPLGTNFSEFLVQILIFSFTKMHLKMSSAKWGPISLGLNVLMSLCSYISILACRTWSAVMCLKLSYHPSTTWNFTYYKAVSFYTSVEVTVYVNPCYNISVRMHRIIRMRD